MKLCVGVLVADVTAAVVQIASLCHPLSGAGDEGARQGNAVWILIFIKCLR